MSLYAGLQKKKKKKSLSITQQNYSDTKTSFPVIFLRDSVYNKASPLSYSKAAFIVNLVILCLNAIVALIQKQSHSPYFVLGEEELISMSYFKVLKTRRI